MSTPSTDTIRRDIEKTREEMDRTVDRLEESLRPERLVEDAWSSVSGSFGGTEGLARGVGRFLRDHPWPLVVLGAGAAWLAFELLRKADAETAAARSDLYAGNGSGPWTSVERRPLSWGAVSLAGGFLAGFATATDPGGHGTSSEPRVRAGRSAGSSADGSGGE